MWMTQFKATVDSTFGEWLKPKATVDATLHKSNKMTQPRAWDKVAMVCGHH